ncbi:hypothetical protein R1sor_019421 [Riccia sorocarpa]|uniref:Glycosyl transferase family 1 domain-containing protein n=1 Tax=Riccia sorocarpa TaxID=122646 RepID=A0ABD3IFT0_9MARC
MSLTSMFECRCNFWVENRGLDLAGGMESGGRSPLQIDLTGEVVRPSALIVGRSFKGSPCLTPTSSPSARRVTPTAKTPPPRRVAENGSSTPTKRSNSGSRLTGASSNSLCSRIFSGRCLLSWIVFVGVWTLVGLHVQLSWLYLEDAATGNEEIGVHFPSVSGIRSLAEGQVSPATGFHRAQVAWTLNWFGKAFGSWMSSTGLISSEELDTAVITQGAGVVLEPVPKQKDEIHKHVSAQQSITTFQQQFPGRRINTQVSGSEGLGYTLVDDLTKGLEDGNAWDSPSASNYTLGTIVGPFDELERSVLGLQGDEEQKPRSHCRPDSAFAKLVSGKSFVIVFHELSMTSAPLSMLELGAKMRSCGGRVSAVVLNKQGSLNSELVARGIRILQDKAQHSWSAAAKADLVVAGSASCASWIRQYLTFNPRGGDRLIWWIMENRRDYFERAKLLLGKPRSLLFLSDTQAMTWREWSAKDGLSLSPDVDVVPLSVDGNLASIANLAGEPDSSNAQRRDKLREEVRRLMGLNSNDVLLASLSSISPGKGQLLLLQAALMVVDHVENEGLAGLAHVETDSDLEYRSVHSSLTGRQIFSLPENLDIFNIFSSSKEQEQSPKSTAVKERHSSSSSGKDRKSSRKVKLPSSKGKKSSLKQRGQSLMRKIVFRFRRKIRGNDGQGNRKPRLRILIGSIGSKKNKAAYLEKISKLLDRNQHLANLTLSTTSTTHVAPLYAAADIYVVNAQGAGESFGRVALEAMAFGLPVLATDNGGSKEIISANVTGFLHPTGRAGIPVLAQNIRRLLDNRAARERMGQKGKEVVMKRYQEDFMYEKLAGKFKRALESADSS